nr:Dihydrofolate reductase [uncultured bacterium]
MIKIVVAYGRDNRVIGEDGKLPWDRIPADMKHFQMTTKGCPIIMGRKTWESMNECPLRNRWNVILTNSSSLPVIPGYDNYIYVRTIEDALISAINKRDDIFVIGGEQVFKQFLDRGLIDEIIATEIKQHYDGDTFFPSLVGNWQKEVIEENDVFDIVKYKRGLSDGID